MRFTLLTVLLAGLFLPLLGGCIEERRRPVVVEERRPVVVEERRPVIVEEHRSPVIIERDRW